MNDISLQNVLRRQKMSYNNNGNGVPFENEKMAEQEFKSLLNAARPTYIKDVSVIVTTVGRITAIKVRIILRTHVSATAPAFVSYSEILELPRLLAAVLCAKLCKSTAFGSDVLDPFCKFLNRTRTDVT